MLNEMKESGTHGHDSPITTYIWETIMGNGDYGDEYVADGMGNGMVRFGKRVLWWNDQGFVYSTKYQTVEDAQYNYAIYSVNYDFEEGEY